MARLVGELQPTVRLAKVLLFSLCVLYLGMCPWVVAKGQETAVAPLSSTSPDLTNEGLSLFRKHCVECHGSDTQESKLRLDSMVDALRGGDSGEPAIVPGDSRRSHLLERVTSGDKKLRMPPEGEPLSKDEIDLLRAWIDSTGQWTSAEKEISERRLTHWSFQPLSRSALQQNSRSALQPDSRSALQPDSRSALQPGPDSHPSSNPIDGFVQAKLSELDLEMSEPADKRRKIRRLYLVMHGLPPDPHQVESFVADTRPDAWFRLVEQVLASPRYGERWAMHWLDLVHFGETNGFETNRERPHAYHYRDWVVSALNSDKPYDGFIKAQIAGDGLGEPIATGFLVAGPHDIVKGQDALLGLMQRQDDLTDIVNTTGTAFLGLTAGCARCHNHKFDPITQSDFYAMQAIFSGVEHDDRDLPLAPEEQERDHRCQNELTELRTALAQYETQRGHREPVNPRENLEKFSPTAARFVRFKIEETSGSEACIDEFEIYCGADNVGLAGAGAKATSSGDFVHPLHKLEHVNDGQFGNPHSWISNQSKGGWVQIELAREIQIDRIVWGRDRQEKFSDRLATKYRIELSIDGLQWQLVASSEDRKPYVAGKQARVTYNFADLPEAEAKAANASLVRIRELEKLRADLRLNRKAYVGTFNKPPAVHRLFRGDPMEPREQVSPGLIAAFKRPLAHDATTLDSMPLTNDASDQQRRLALADWIASADNPLTSRVIVNRIWQFHFGTGIVDTPSDFGANGTRPTHPELLDWLAVELIERGWSLKELHRLILHSNTWQQDSRPRDAAMRADGATRLLWRFPPRRLEAEGIRDCILAASGKLDLRMRGPGFSAFEVELENVRHYFPKKAFGAEDWRRMIYMTKVRQEKDAIFGVFDCPDGSQVAPKRTRSTTPLQALNLLNSHFVMQQAQMLADRLMNESDSAEGRVQGAYRLCFGRDAGSEELSDAIEFVAQNGWVQFSRALLNSNEFVFIS